MNSRAQDLASQFSMSFESALQLSQLADRMNAMSSAGALTDDDRTAIADAALSVAGITNEQVTTAYSNFIKGDQTAVNGLLTQAAVNLGMPSSAGLRDQILPSLGINLGSVGK